MKKLLLKRLVLHCALINVLLLGIYLDGVKCADSDKAFEAIEKSKHGTRGNGSGGGAGGGGGGGGQGELAKKDDDSDNGDGQAEPPFPGIYDAQKFGVLKIVSEVIGTDVGYQTNEEYIDFEAGQAVYVMTNHDKGQRIAYSDIAQPNATYLYWPYECRVMGAEEKIEGTYDDIKFQLTIKGSEGLERGNVRLFGALALWYYVLVSPRRYSRGKLVYDPVGRVSRPAHVWEVLPKDSGRGAKLRAQFVDLNWMGNKENPNLVLESIQVISGKESGEILRTFNVLSVEWVPRDESIDLLMQKPVGFGCPGLEGAPLIDILKPRADISKGDTVVEFEATETKLIDSGRSQQVTTVNVQYFSTSSSPQIDVLRLRDSRRDTKLVRHHGLAVAYVIDQLYGNCTIRHNTPEAMHETVFGQPADDGIGTLELDERVIKYLTQRPSGPEFTKVSEPRFKGAARHLFFERTVKWPLDLEAPTWADASTLKELESSKYFARIIRNYAIVSDYFSDLVSITIWVFATSNKSAILKTYHLTVLNCEHLIGVQQQAQLIDLSEECYINNAAMKSGRDYAWLELFYPAPSRSNAMLARDEWNLRERIFRELLHYKQRDEYANNFKGMDVLRLPKVELMFGDEGFEVRLLMLDFPSMDKIFRQHVGARMEVSSKQTGHFHSRVAPDAEHCAHLCRMHFCTSFGYCQLNRQCVWRSIGYENSVHYDEKPDLKCSFYDPDVDQLQLEFLSNLYNSSLATIISKLQFQDYSHLVPPKLPDELLEDQSLATEDSANTLASLQTRYYHDTLLFLERNNFHLNELILLLSPIGHPELFMPSKFTLEDDPLDSFSQIEHELASAAGGGAGGSGSSGENSLGAQWSNEQLIDYFSEGLSGYRYKLLAFPEELRNRVRELRELTYDQCALACLDTKCASFSYCPNHNECVLTSVNKTQLAMNINVIEPALECYIAKRDFLRNFQQFNQVYRPQTYTRQLKSSAVAPLTPSDCALECVAESKFNCLSFQLCAEGSPSEPASSCFFQVDRQVSFMTSGTGASNKHKATGCTHYERSYLADFNRIDNRQIDAEQLAKLETSTYEGANVFQCAEICANQLTDCGGFQFCLDLHDTERAQSCRMIQSKPDPSDASEFGALVDEQQGGKLLKTGKFIKASDRCHLFFLRRDSSEAHARDLTMGNMMTVDEQRQALAEASSGAPGIGLGWLGCVVLFLGVASVSVVVGFGLAMANERNQFARRQLDRVRILLGV